VLLAAQSTEQIELHRRIDGAGIASGADFFARGKIAISAQAKKGIALLTDQKTKEFLAEPGYYEP
jgi:hypothetical protein